jgi:Flp pilus assembly protein TadD
VDLLAEYRRAGQYLAAGDAVSAARLLEPICAAEPANAEVRLQLALAYFGSAQLGRAEAELRTLVDRDPSDHYAHHVLGRTLERLNRPADALTHLRLAYAMSPVRDYRDALDRVSGKVSGRPSGRR